eukprot:4356795-Pyramimonas_sp.AAC.1
MIEYGEAGWIMEAGWKSEEKRNASQKTIAMQTWWLECLGTRPPRMSRRRTISPPVPPSVRADAGAALLEGLQRLFCK